MKNYKKRRELLEHCNERFYPYMEKVLERLPENVRNKEVLGDPTLKIVSFDAKSFYGTYMSFGSPIKQLIILNESLLTKPEFEIIHTIAHELAHKVARTEKTTLYEKEAEELLVEWGFERESKMASYHRPILETEGFKIGYEWAKRSNLTDFEEFYDEWNEGRLTAKRYERLLYTAGPSSILDEMGYIEESETISPNDRWELPKNTMVDDGSLDKGIIEGIMYFLRGKKAEARSTLDSTANKELEFTEQLKRTFIEIRKVFDCSAYSKYIDKLPDLSKAYLQMSDLLRDEEGSN